jgi:hypothetical protein
MCMSIHSLRPINSYAARSYCCALHLTLRGHSTVLTRSLSSCQGPNLSCVVMGAAPEVLGKTHTSVLFENDHPCPLSTCIRLASQLQHGRQEDHRDGNPLMCLTFGRQYAQRALAQSNGQSQWPVIVNASFIRPAGQKLNLSQ